MNMLTKKARKTILAIVLFAGIVVGCSKDDGPTVDREPPTIDISFTGAFPIQCSEVKRGETFVVKTHLADNVALGSFSIDIHHNFDHHSHSTEVVECELGAVKQAVNPFLFIRSYNIPDGLRDYETDIEITVPDDIDPGDYHFMIQVTDKEGWGNMIGLSIKII